MKEILIAEYKDRGDFEVVQEQVLRMVEQIFQLKVGKAVVYALAKKGQTLWSPEQIQDALKPESLTLVADDWPTNMRQVRVTMSAMFKEAAE